MKILVTFLEKLKIKKRRNLFLLGLTPLFLIGIGITIFDIYYYNRILPGVYASNLLLAGKTRVEAEALLKNQIKTPGTITLLAKGKKFDLSLNDIDLSYDIQSTVNSAYHLYRSENIISDIFNKPISLFTIKSVPIVTTTDEGKLNEYLQVISSQVATEPVHPSVIYSGNEVNVEKGSAGENIDNKKFRKNLEQQLASEDYSDIHIPFRTIDPALSEEESESLKKRAETLVEKRITLQHEYDLFSLKENELFSFLDARENFNEENIFRYVEKEISPRVNREPQNAVFRFEGGKVIEFLPGKDGITIDRQLLKDQLIDKLASLETSDEKTSTLIVPVQTDPPKVTTDQVNNLGINELLGSGISKFKGSIPGRVFNIGHASSKLNGVLVAPGETLSFNQAVGEVSSLTGYKQAYVIKDGRTVLGDGGGVCQVSTTLFRAALAAGLPINERRAHSYRVGYYEQNSPPGLDATVYSPTTDLKIKNDTPGHILVQTIFKPFESTLIFEIYGTNDGRIATTTKPVVTSVTAPPEDLYVDDPTLPTGVVKQVDYKAWGAKAVFDYKVERDGVTTYEKRFVSNYRPWQAVYLKGTGVQQ
ncbi:hypothetical protein A3A75_02875 [Candidatus Woesebacteria bacterium RIFCSPLOWO2_01_FULL_39_10]|uniref:YoaR-like putative peptidoglycan binding domain-containing protein n=1 Tax=Candidatus Woesebacteria bacterium RIFCSPLOWO2_01_FULL_39_10 TaxID=1802516 RepID=A0A1F8B703_9BACT|nr:MAG: hypothetical protein A3A75_02875 [Candidatus Woesebacteria bacterium RIFCSPLOWO2_01_FULL_39_10]